MLFSIGMIDKHISPIQEYITEELSCVWANLDLWGTSLVNPGQNRPGETGSDRIGE
jgi:hypothetical protein